MSACVLRHSPSGHSSPSIQASAFKTLFLSCRTSLVSSAGFPQLSPHLTSGNHKEEALLSGWFVLQNKITLGHLLTSDFS